MKECMITNMCCMVAGSIAITVACHVTKSAKPLWAFLLIPRYNYTNTNDEKGEKMDNRKQNVS